MWSPCLEKGNGWASTSVAPDMCINTEACRNDPVKFALDNAYTNTSTYGNIIGFAKDGHMIIGPYNQNGELWSCSDHDACNGVFINNEYFYVSTTTFPYVLGCFGPASGAQAYAVTCSNSSCPDHDDSKAFNAIASISAATLIATIALSF